MDPNDNVSAQVKTKWLTGIFLFALVLRAAFLCYFEAKNLGKLFIHDGYITLAQYWLGWIDITDFDRLNPAPGFAVWCALLFKLLGRPSEVVVQVGNVLLSAGASVLIFFAARRYMDEKIGLVAAFIAALSPAFVFFAPHLQSESFFVFIEVLFFLGLARWGTMGLAKVLLLGFFGGLVCLTRSAFAVYFPLLMMALLFMTLREKKSIVPLILFGIAWMLPIAARTAMNWRTDRRIIPLTVQSGLTLYAGISLNAEDRVARIMPVWAEMKEKGITYWPDQDNYFGSLAKDYIREHPIRYAGIVAQKFFQYWRPWPRPPYPPIARWALGIYYTALFVFAASGIWLTRSKWSQLLPLYALFGALSISHSFFDTSLRYRMPLEPWLCMFAAAGLIRAARPYITAAKNSFKETQ